MWFWMTLSILQAVHHFWPISQWVWMFRRARCSYNGCVCRYFYTPGEATPKMRREIEDETMKVEFANSVWNMYEKRRMSKWHRIAKDVDKYFRGYTGG